MCCMQVVAQAGLKCKCREAVVQAAEPVHWALLNREALWLPHGTRKDRASLQWHLIRTRNSRTFRLWIATTSPALYATRPFSAKR